MFALGINFTLHRLAACFACRGSHCLVTELRYPAVWQETHNQQFGWPLWRWQQSKQSKSQRLWAFSLLHEKCYISSRLYLLLLVGHNRKQSLSIAKYHFAQQRSSCIEVHWRKCQHQLKVILNACNQCKSVLDNMWIARCTGTVHKMYTKKKMYASYPPNAFLRADST